MDQKDPQSLDNASRDFLDVLQSDKRLAQTREQEREQQRKRGGQTTVTENGARADGKARTAAPSGAPALSRASEPAAPQPLPGPLVARRTGDETEGTPGTASPPLVAGQRPARPAGDAGPRLPTGVAQQPPSAGLARPPLAGGATIATPAQNSTQAPAAGQQGNPLALVDARTLAALASGLAAPPPAGRLVGPMASGALPPPAGLGAESEKASLVGPTTRLGGAPGLRPPAPATLSAVTPVEVRERIQLWMLTGVLDTAPMRFPAIDPLQTGEVPAARQGVTRGTAVTPLARGVAAKPLGGPSVPLSPADDGPAQLGPFPSQFPSPFSGPSAANDGTPALGQAMQQDHLRRGGVRPDADRGVRGGGPKPLDFARVEREARTGQRMDREPSTRLDIPGLGVPRV